MFEQLVHSDIFSWYNYIMGKVYSQLKCCIEGCENSVSNKTNMLCNRHYLLLRRHGSPLKQTRRSPEPGSNRGHYLYKTWDMIRQRCYNKNFSSYKNYGGRGIRMSPEWESSFVKFSEYIDTTLGKRPEGCTLDRIDNDQGYVPGNLRWASREEQQRNRRGLGRSGIVGVYRRVDTGKWVARIGWGGKDIREQYDTVEEAKVARKRMEEEYGTTQD